MGVQRFEASAKIFKGVCVVVRRMLELTAIDMSIPVFEDREQAAAAVLETGP